MAVEQGEGGLVEGAQVRIGGRLRSDGRPALRLGQVQRPVGHVHQGVLRPAVVRVAGDADADGHARASGRPGQVGHGPADADRDLVGDDPVGARAG